MSINSERVICAVCGKEYMGVVPKHGNGTVLFPRRHQGTASTCPGSFREGRIV